MLINNSHEPNTPNPARIYKDPFSVSQLKDKLIALLIVPIIFYLMDFYFLDNPDDVEKGLFSYFISVFVGLNIALLYLISVQRLVFKLHGLLRFFISVIFMIILIIGFVEFSLHDLPWIIINCVSLSFIMGVYDGNK
jgi:hypothetical protein